MNPISQNESKNIEIDKLVGNWSFYNKQIGSLSRIPYPIILKNTNNYFDKIEHSTIESESFTEKPFLFLEYTSASSIALLKFSPQKIRLKTNSVLSTHLIFQQNYYPHWFYCINNLKYPVRSFDVNFMQIPISRGAEEVTIVFEPKWVVFGMAFSAIAILIGTVILFWGYHKK
jgi:hypothetical protein